MAHGGQYDVRTLDKMGVSGDKLLLQLPSTKMVLDSHDPDILTKDASSWGILERESGGIPERLETPV